MHLSHLSMTGPAAVAGLLALVAPVQSGAQDSSANGGGERPVSAGVYTDAQAKRGAEVFLVNCVSCHSTKDYTGETFKVAWVSRSAFDIFDQIRKLMPEDNPGILTAQQYADVVAYMFSLNGYPAGQAELPAQDEPLKRMKIDAPPRPSPHDAAALGALRRYQQRLLR
jgi:mono/diheme cytochrome c family protein